MIAATVAGVPGAAHAREATPPRQAGGRALTAVTLITGDHVTVLRDGSVAVAAGAGRQGTSFLSQKIKNHRYVIPADALPLLRSGRIDQRLFDVTALIEYGYTDRVADLPLLVAYPKTSAAARSATAVRGVRVVRDLPVVGALAVRVDRAARASLWDRLTSRSGTRGTLAAGVDHVWLDGKRKISLDVSVPQIGAPEAWKAGLDGTGVTVAVLDSGVDATHPDLATQIAGAANFTDTPSTDDTVGHGTHVASIIAGTGAASDGKYRGVAPGAKLLIGKICGDEFCEESDILEGMAWAAPQAQVINMSIGAGDEPGIDPLEEAINTLTARYDALFVVAAGNSGGFAPVSSPGSADAALTVGAVDDEDKLADFSSRGPRIGDDAIKPDITAPGVDIIAARAANGVMGDPAPNAAYTSLSGTSMATPHVAGSAAILAQQHPGWTARQRKSALMGSAVPSDGVDVFGQGAGRVDVAREITQSVEVDGGSVSFGRQLWPHGDDTPVTKPVTYRNLGTEPVTLSLALAGDAPAGMFRLGATTLTVPAGGTAATTLTADTTVGSADGYFGGYLTATAAGGVRVSTPYAVNKEVESYDVTLTHTNRDGRPSADFFTALTGLSNGADILALGDGVSNSKTLRLPKGDYGMFSWITTGSDTEGNADDTFTMLVQTRLVVHAAATIPLDARAGKPISVTVPHPRAVPTLIAANAEWQRGGSSASASFLTDRFKSLYTAQIGGTAPEESFLGSANVSFAERRHGSFLNSPYTYDLGWFYPGTFFTGLHKSPRGRDLATINARYATEATGALGIKANSARYSDSSYWSVLIPFDLPFSRTEYVNVDGKAKWSSSFSEVVPSAGEEFLEEISGSVEPPATYRAGRSYPQEWNRAVFGPSLAEPSWPVDWVTRTGDTISVFVPLWSEGSGHAGYSSYDTMHYRLYSGSTLVGEFDGEYGEFPVPAGPAQYRLEATATRGAPHTLATRVDGAWTFRSGHVDGEVPQRLALSSVRISPVLDEHNTAPAGRAFDVPLTVEHQSGSTAGRATAVTAEVSYDDGRTWRPVPLRGTGDERVATLRHPSEPGFVSLRVHASDAGGNTVTATVVRAYAIA